MITFNNRNCPAWPQICLQLLQGKARIFQMPQDKANKDIIK